MSLSAGGSGLTISRTIPSMIEWVVGIALNGLRHLAVHAISNFLDGRYIAFHRLCDQRIHDTAEFRDVVGVDLIEGGDEMLLDDARARVVGAPWRIGFLLGMACWLHAKCLRYLASRLLNFRQQRFV